MTMQTGTSGGSGMTMETGTAGGMRPADLDGLVTVGAPAVSPDGTLVAYVVRTVDVPADTYRSALWLATADGSAAPRRLTTGDRADDQPVWSPDGTHLAFTGGRGPAGTPFTLHLLPVDGPGEPVTVAARDEPFEAVRFAPDGTRLAFASRVRAARYATNGARRIDRLFARKEGVGWVVDRPSQLFVVEARAGAEPRQLTDGPADCQFPAWAPDSRRLAYVTARDEYADLGMVNDIWVSAVDGTEPDVRLTAADAVFRAPAWSPDGSRIAFVQHSGPTGGRLGWRHARLATIDVATRERTVLTAAHDRNCAAMGITAPPVWDGPDLLVLCEDAGTVGVLRVDPAGGVTSAVAGRRAVTGFGHAAGTTAFTAMDLALPTELYVLRADAGRVPSDAEGGVPVEERRLTAHQNAFVAACPPLPAEHFTVRSEDGCEIDAWLVRPAGFDPDRTYPLLLSIHGGPQTQYGEWWFDEFQLYASAGFAVLYCNPHGSTGGTERFARSYLSPLCPQDPGNGWGGIDYRDLMTVTDAALARFAFLDPARLGVLGGSYGGNMTTWIVTQTDRFTAACSERALNSGLSAEGSSDMGGLIQLETGIDPLVHPDELAAWSPFRYASTIGTPLLILHSDEDLRCPPEQADALFVALRLQRKPVEYWRFPGTNHDLSRSGPPRLRVERAELIIEWFRRYLGEG
ncbi:S9 family peptidase [Streptosporangium sp. NPDC051022]|uniref:S9 family peptidase n=1 Tax=Streptosporangium sp. NPDC051022 TaxID=3155752 RepID=UPI00343CBCBB